MKTNPTIKSRINRFLKHPPISQMDSPETINSWAQYLRTGGNWCCGLSLVQILSEIEHSQRIKIETTKCDTGIKKPARKWFAQHEFSWLTRTHTEVFCN